MQFSLNVSTLFQAVPLIERFGVASRAGFGAVESWWPEDLSLDLYADAVLEAGAQLVLLNFYGGRLASGDRGLAGDPERWQEFRENVPIALELAAQLGCRLLHALIGKELAAHEREDQLRLAVENVRWAADLAGRQGAKVVIEPLNRFDNGPTLIQDVDSALAFIRAVGRENVGLQFDVYHVERTEGGVPEAIMRAAGSIDHVQIADAPGRGHPGSGGIDFVAVMRALDRSGYAGYVGLEYLAEDGGGDLAWLPRSLRHGDHSFEAVVRGIADV